MAGGSSGGGGGVVVGGPSPAATSVAGLYEQQAASAAAQAYQQATSQAMQEINNQYAGALGLIQPYTEQGIQALDKANSMMGLSAYKPSTAPVSPTQPQLSDFLKNITPAQEANYASQYMTDTTVKNPIGQSFTFPVYSGPGSYNNVVVGGTANQAGKITTPADGSSLLGSAPQYTSAALGGYILPSVEPGGANNQMQASSALQIPGVKGAIQNALAQQQLDAANKDYQSQLNIYNQQKGLYDYANQQAQGFQPMSSDQLNNYITNLPGYGSMQKAGIQAIQNSAAAKGLGGSGALLQDLANYGSNLESSFYNQQLSNLLGEASAGQNAATNVANMGQQSATGIGNLITGNATNQANALLAAAQAQANAYLAGNQQYNVIGGGGGGGSNLSGIGSILGGVGSVLGSGGISSLL